MRAPVTGVADEVGVGVGGCLPMVGGGVRVSGLPLLL